MITFDQAIPPAGVPARECSHEGPHVIDFHGAAIRGGTLVIPGADFVVQNAVMMPQPAPPVRVGFRGWLRSGVDEARAALAERLANWLAPDYILIEPTVIDRFRYDVLRTGRR